MSESKFCRVCADLADKTSPLFEGSLRKLLPKIKDITGLQLENIKDMPQNICRSCEKQILHAHKFRERCIRAQKCLGTLTQNQNHKEDEETSKSKGKHKAPDENDSLKIKNEEAPPIEEVIFNETNVFKAEQMVENEDRDEDEEEQAVLLKQEPTNDEDSSNDGDFNFLGNDVGDDFHAEDKDTLAIEPEISLVPADEQKLKQKQQQQQQPTSPPLLNKKNQRTLKPLKKIAKTNETAKKRRCAVEKNYICDQCGRHFTNTGYFNMHMLRHSGNRSFQCKLCPKAYYRSVDLDNHMMKHTGEKPYPCKYCERRFNDKSHLVRHTRGEHTNERPFACDQCPKTFISSNNLKHHLVTHSGLRAYKCKLCNMSYKRTTHLSGHYRSVMHKQNLEKQNALDNTIVGVTQESGSIIHAGNHAQSAELAQAPTGR